MIGKIEKVPLRSIWKHEVISQAVGFELLNVEREQSTGNFNVDLVAEDSSGHTIIIENQLEKSDHDHLGKIITCLSSFDAQVAVWIVAEPRPEHIGAVSWLNESTSAKFYLLKVEGLRIGESAPAPLLTLIVGPSEAIENAGKTKREKKERHELRKQFWTVVLEKSKAKHLLFNAISPSDATYLSAGAGKSGISFQCILTKEKALTRSTLRSLTRSRSIRRKSNRRLVFLSTGMNYLKIEPVLYARPLLRLDTKVQKKPGQE